MTDARRYAVWPEPTSKSRSLKGSRPSVPHGTNFYIINICYLFHYFLFTIIFFKFYLEWIQNVFLTSTDLQTRRARCQHQLSFLFTFMLDSSHEPISYRFQDKRRFRSKIANFCHPMNLMPAVNGFFLELGTDARGQKEFE